VKKKLRFCQKLGNIKNALLKMIHSPNLNVIVKSLEKISSKLARDYAELENLQMNNFSAVKFSNSCFARIEEDLIRELAKVRPDYNIRTAFGKKITNNESSEFQYVIASIDGMFNLSRSLASFSSFVALEHISGESKEVISVAILNVAANEIYRCEKGSGAFLNNRKIKVSKRELKDGILCALGSCDLENHHLLKVLKDANAVFQVSNCSSSDISHLASGKIDLAIFKAEDEEFLSPSLLLAKEAGAKIEKKEDLIFVKNEKIIIK
jgi:myo-inositol-1(or 4)-monophosphatase